MELFELDFESDIDAVAYVAREMLKAEQNDERAISFIEFVWDRNPDLIEQARELLNHVDHRELF